MTLNSSSIRPAVQAITIGIAAALALGACGSTSSGHLSAANESALTPSAAPTSSVPLTSGVSLISRVSPTSSAPFSSSAAVTPASAVDPALNYVPLVEPFSSPGTCTKDDTTLAMTYCILQKVVAVDATVDRLQRRRFERAATRSQQRTDLQDDARWLKNRTRTAAANPTGGSIDQILAAQTLLRISKQRVSFLTEAG